MNWRDSLQFWDLRLQRHFPDSDSSAQLGQFGSAKVSQTAFAPWTFPCAGQHLKVTRKANFAHPSVAWDRQDIKQNSQLTQQNLMMVPLLPFKIHQNGWLRSFSAACTLSLLGNLQKTNFLLKLFALDFCFHSFIIRVWVIWQKTHPEHPKKRSLSHQVLPNGWNRDILTQDDSRCLDLQSGLKRQPRGRWCRLDSWGNSVGLWPRFLPTWKSQKWNYLVAGFKVFLGKCLQFVKTFKEKNVQNV